MMVLYEKRPLLNSSRAVRLLRLLDRRPNTTIECQLETFELEQAPAYVALSYTWGSETSKNHDISINGDRFKIRENLWTYLERARQSSKPSKEDWIWVDAVCINQDDHLE